MQEEPLEKQLQDAIDALARYTSDERYIKYLSYYAAGHEEHCHGIARDQQELHTQIQELIGKFPEDVRSQFEFSADLLDDLSTQTHRIHEEVRNFTDRFISLFQRAPNQQEAETHIFFFAMGRAIANHYRVAINRLLTESPRERLSRRKSHRRKGK